MRTHATWLAIALSLGAFGCSTTFPRNTPGTGFGQIVVGSPRVESRDRLINERREQEDWLVKQLEVVRTATYGFSGATSLTSTSFLGAQANLSLDPQYRQDALTRARQTQSQQVAADEEKAIAGLRSSGISEIIGKYNKKELTFKQACDELTAIGASCTQASAATQPSAKPVGPATAPSTSYLDKDKSERLDVPTGAVPRTQSSISPLDDFQNRLAASESVRNELNDIRGDDGHDLAGNTLYRLTFDTTVMPYDDASAWAVVKVKVKHDLSKLDGKQLLQAASERYLRYSVEATEAHYRTMLNNIKQVCWKQEITDTSQAALPQSWRGGRAGAAQEEAAFRRVFLCASKDLGSNSRRAMERQLSSWQPKVTQVGDIKSDTPELRRLRMQDLLTERPMKGESDAAFAARQGTLRIWAVWLADVFDMQARADFEGTALSCYFEHVSKPTRAGAFPYDLEARKADNPQARCAGLGRDDSSFKDVVLRQVRSSVYAVTPKESVQQLSEVSSNKKATEFLLGLSAIANTAGVNAAIQSIKANTAQYEAIRRQPLVVGFTERGNTCSTPDQSCSEELSFGWLFGPSFTLSDDGKSTNFRHTLAQKSVAAQLAVPAWLDVLGITVETSWRKENGDNVVTDAANRAVASTVNYQLKLPSTIVDVFDTLDKARGREPRVDQYQYLEVVEGQPANVLITGRDVWRSAEVHIGSQRATLVRLLPNNRGVVAHFDDIASTSGMSKSENGTVRLTLHTSEGEVVAGQVTVQPNSKQAPSGTPEAKKTEPEKSKPTN